MTRRGGGGAVGAGVGVVVVVVVVAAAAAAMVQGYAYTPAANQHSSMAPGQNAGAAAAGSGGRKAPRQAERVQTSGVCRQDKNAAATPNIGQNSKSLARLGVHMDFPKQFSVMSGSFTCSLRLLVASKVLVPLAGNPGRGSSTGMGTVRDSSL